MPMVFPSRKVTPKAKEVDDDDDGVTTAAAGDATPVASAACRDEEEPTLVVAPAVWCPSRPSVLTGTPLEEAEEPPLPMILVGDATPEDATTAWQLCDIP
mmetsp:Transcript_38576/g.90627  ORF Transcript_38576/g.90627 Transcript_38576/m.90627 type:complete len:100 (+) Transcript_38576:979-1278(+)